MSFRLFCAVALTATVAVAADPNPPTIISPTSSSVNGIAPNGIAVSPTSILFTQPYADGLQPRGVYSITTGGVVTQTATIPTAAGVTAENGIAIVPSPAGSGFTTGDVYATGVSPTISANDAVYKNGSATPFIDGLSASLSSHQSALEFDAVGTFGGALIVTHDTTISLYNAGGTLLATYTGPAGLVLQASTVAPLSYAACPGCIFVTAMPQNNINSPTPSGDGEILTVSPGAASGTAAVLFATTAGIPEPESIHFITAQTLSCSVGGFSYFASGYATGSLFNSVSTNGAILAWTPAQLSPYVGHYLVQNEEFTGPAPGIIYADAGLGSQSVFYSETSTATGYQLEDTSIAQCVPATGCPATQGFWHKASRWPSVSATVDGVTYDGTTTPKTMTIGGISYTQAQLLLIMPSGALHTGGYVNALSQFVAAVLNLAAGAQHTATIDAAISAINTDLAGVHFINGTSLGTVSASLQATLAGFETTLDNYNSAVGLGCSEGAGLNTGN